MARHSWIFVCAVFLATPFAHAHIDGGLNGTPKSYCEWWDTNTHEYGPPVEGWLIAGLTDGSVPDCDWDGVPGGDGHFEYMSGGAILLAESWSSWECYGAWGDHPYFPYVTVTDLVLGGSLPFTVAADGADEFYPCGNGFILPCQGDQTPPACDAGDQWITIDPLLEGEPFKPLLVDFPPGADGAYLVFVGDRDMQELGTQGHVATDWDFLDTADGCKAKKVKLTIFKSQSTKRHKRVDGCNTLHFTEFTGKITIEFSDGTKKTIPENGEATKADMRAPMGGADWFIIHGVAEKSVMFRQQVE